MGCGRKRVRRLSRRTRRADPWSQPSRSRGSGHGAGGEGRALRRLPRPGSAVGRTGSANDPVRGAGAFHGYRHGGDAPRAARVARIHRQEQRSFASPAIFTAGTTMSVSRPAARLALSQASSKILSWLAPNDLRQVEHWLASRSDIAALILEPTGATFGQIPTTRETLRRLRELTTRYGVLLIFDEVISGFRCSPGGAQQFYGVIPDLTTLAKILAAVIRAPHWPAVRMCSACWITAGRTSSIAAGAASGHLQRRASFRRGRHCDARGDRPQRRHRPRCTHGRGDSRRNQCGNPPPRPEMVRLRPVLGFPPLSRPRNAGRDLRGQGSAGSP